MTLIRPSITHSIMTHLGKMYVVVTLENNKPFEIFGYVKGGDSCLKTELEVIGRLSNLAIRHGAATEEIIQQLKDIQCEPVWDNGVQIQSVADGVAQCLIMTLNSITTGVGQANITLFIPMEDSEEPPVQST